MNTITLINKAQFEALITMDDIIAAVRDTYKDKARGRAIAWPTIFHEFVSGESDMDIRSGALDARGFFGHKTIGWFGKNLEQGKDGLQSTLCLFHEQSGEIAAVIDARSITALRTGAAGALGAHVLARADAKNALIIGVGGQCLYQVAALLTLRPEITTVRIANPHHPEKATNKVRELTRLLPEKFGISLDETHILAVDDLVQAVKESDIIITITAAREPLIQKEWVSPGTHVSCVGADMPGKVEIDPALMADARLFVDDTEHCLEAGELERAYTEGLITAEKIVGELGEVLLGIVPGRTSDEDITVFDTAGMAIVDIAVGVQALRKAETVSNDLGITTLPWK